MSRQKKKNIRLLLSEVNIDERKYQDRIIAGNGLRGRWARKKQSDDHIKGLTNSIQLSGKQLDPMSVWLDPLSSKYYVVDGHHRYEAYKAAQWRSNKKITCYVIDANTSEEALMKVYPENAKASIGMTLGERLEKAWRLRLEQHIQRKKMTLRKMADTAMVSKSVIGDMDKVIRRIEKDKPLVSGQWPGTWVNNKVRFKFEEKEDMGNEDGDARIINNLADKMATLLMEHHPHLAQQALRKVIDHHNDMLIPREALLVNSRMSDESIGEWKQAVTSEDYSDPFGLGDEF